MRHEAGGRRHGAAPPPPLQRLLGRSRRVRRRRLALVAFLAVLLLGVTGIVAASGWGGSAVPVSASRGPSPAPRPSRRLLTPPPSAVGVGPAATPSAAAATGPGANAPSSGSQPGFQKMPEDIAEAVAAYGDSEGAAGIALAISTGSGGSTQARYLTTTGQAAAGTPWSADTRSAYRSITKSFVGTVVLQLVGESKLRLDDPLAKYVPGVAGLEFNGTSLGSQITVREALEMRTGVTEFSGTAAFSDQLDADYAATFSDDQLLAYAFARGLDFAPGSSYEYSNTNYVLLGKVIEAVTGRAWDAEVQSRVLAPLGLSSVSYSGTRDPSGKVATPYETSSSGLESLAQVSPSLYGASGGFFGDISDLLAWGRALGSGSLITPALQQARLTAASEPRVDEPGSPDYDTYGLGAGSLDGWWGHTGTGLGYEALTMYSPSSGTTIAILINTQLSNPNGPAALFRQLEERLADFQ